MAKIIPVIHTVDIYQVMYNVEMCVNNGINDIFLIDAWWERISNGVDWVPWSGL